MTNISVQTSKETEGKALHKPDVGEAKSAKQYVTSKSVQIEKRTEGKYCTIPAFDKRSTQRYKRLLNQLKYKSVQIQETVGKGKTIERIEANG